MFDYGYDYDDRLATEAEADREYAHAVGEMDRTRPWILSDRDVWYANPYYNGPAVPHPEDEIYEAIDLFFFNSQNALGKCPDLVQIASGVIRNGKVFWDNGIDDEIPF